MKSTTLKLNGRKLAFFSVAIAMICLASSMTMLFGGDYEPYVRTNSVEVDTATYQLEELASLDAMDAKLGSKYRTDLMDDVAGEVEETILISDGFVAGEMIPTAEVPEPATATLIVAGAVALMMKRRRKNA